MAPGTSTATTWLDDLDDDECRMLLERSAIGRLGFTVGTWPVILPVNVVMHDGNVLVRTEPGRILRAARSRHPACLEVDDVDRLAHAGWTVMASGHLEEITDETGAGIPSARLPLLAWGRPHARYLVRLRVEALDGRRIAHRPAGGTA